jgi:copper transport protein
VVLGAALLLAICAILAPSQASRVSAQAFHAVLVHSDPANNSVLEASPGIVRLWFSEPVQLVEPSLTIYGPSGGMVEQGTVQEINGEVSVPFKASADGTYLVIWQVISQDTDPVSGSFVFSLRHPGGSWSGAVSSNVSLVGQWLQILAHLLHFLGYALGFGSLVFLSLVVYPLRSSGQDALQESIWRLVNLSILVLVLAEGVALLAQSASLGKHALFDPTFLATVLGSSFGRALALRLGAALALWVLMGIARQGNRHAVSAALILGVLLASVDSTSSHAITAPVVWMALMVTALHLMAMGVWLGGLMTLLVLWRLKEAASYHRELVARFSYLALVSVVELILTGVVLTGLHLQSLKELLTTTYGRVLTGKILALALPLLFAALSRRKRSPSPVTWWLLELFALVGILVLAGALASLPPLR